MRIFLLVTFSILLASCSAKQDASVQKKVSSNIYGGERVLKGKWKSVVSISKLSYDGEIGKSFCTGTLIDEKTVLSAAHCFSRVKDYYMRSAAVTLEDTDDSLRFYTKIKNIRIHPQYEGEDSGYDFALIDLEESTGVTTEDIIPASQLSKVSIGQEIDLVGFGKIEDGSNGVKFEVKTQIRGEERFEFTAGGEGRDTCSGDSGGPAFIKNELGEYEFYGVTSRTPDDASTFCGDKTIYGKVSTAMKWVKAERLIDLAIKKSSKESIALLTEAKRLQPKYFKIYTTLGELYLKLGMLSKALGQLTVANQLNLENLKTLELIRETYSRLGDIDSEILILRRLLVLDPNNEAYFNRLDFFGETAEGEIYRGVGRFRRGDLALARLDLELHLDNPFATLVMAFSEFKLSNFDEALRLLKSISEEDIVTIDFKDKRGDTFLLAAVFEDQAEIVKELLRFNPSLNIVDVYGNNLAEVAWWGRNFQMIRLLRTLGVEWDPNLYFKQFTFFIKGVLIDDVRFMLDMGIDLTLVGPDGETAISLARETNNQELIELIESYAKEEKSLK